MQKILAIISLSYQSVFAFRFEFFFWRVRLLLRIVMTIVLWQAIFQQHQSILGYTQSQIYTYVFLVLIVGSLTFSLLSSNYIGSEISSGDLNHYLLKPFSYIHYWYIRNLADKFLNFIFSIFEIGLFYILIRPQITITSSFANILISLALIFSAITIYYYLHLICEMVGFWAPENMWALSFLLIVSTEILGGALFPLDVLPANIFSFVQLLPFPYILYFPIQVLLGKVSTMEAILLLCKSLLWVIGLTLVVKVIWQKGLRVYGAYGQ